MELQETPTPATSCFLPLNRREDPLELPLHTTPPSFLFLPRALSPSLFLSPVHSRRDRARPPSIAAVPHLPLLPRPAEEHHLAVLFLPANQIGPGCPELPPLAAVPSQVPTTAALICSPPVSPPATPTSLAIPG
jgi:hypothetical protein